MTAIRIPFPLLHGSTSLRYDPVLRDDVVEWCEECLQPGWKTRWMAIPSYQKEHRPKPFPVIDLACIEDAVLFRLRWSSDDAR